MTSPAPIVLFTVGTLGDVRPCIALGAGLRRAGFPVRVATNANFAEMVRKAGLEFYPFLADSREQMSKHLSVIENKLNLLTLAKTYRRRLPQMVADWVEKGRVACDGAGLVIGNGGSTLLAASLAEALDIPFAQAQLQPQTPSRAYPPTVFPVRQGLPGAINLGLHHLSRFLTWQLLLSPAINGVLRRQLGLPGYPWHGPNYDHDKLLRRVLYGFSSVLVPRPADWPEGARLTGDWALDRSADWQAPAALQQFLADGAEPIYLGFGSMMTADAGTFTDTVLEAVRSSGRRAVIATGWGALHGQAGALDERLFVIDQVRHDWLFPRVSLAVHHGGAGTTAAATHAGIPSVVVPFLGDQPFWAHALQQLGAAPPPLNRKTLTPAQLAHAITVASQAPMRLRARELGERMRAEDGVQEAIRILDEWGLLPSRLAHAMPPEPKTVALA